MLASLLIVVHQANLIRQSMYVAQVEISRLCQHGSNEEAASI
jgi:hypothetical protein